LVKIFFFKLNQIHSNKVAYVGGIFGLFAGVSMLTATEIADFVVQAIEIMCKKLKTKILNKKTNF
jgi:hypothetical protein